MKNRSSSPGIDFLIKAVLFDFDGVLVNSMSFHVKAWQTIFRDIDIEIKPEDVLLTEGSRSIELARQILTKKNVETSEEALINLVAKKQRKYREITKAKLTNSAESFIIELKKQGMLIGLVTGTPRLNVEEILTPELISRIDVMVTADDTQAGKPNPECYLKAVSLLNVEPGQCLVVENAPLGIQAAKNAGMKVVALTTTLNRSYLVGADFYATDLSDLENSW